MIEKNSEMISLQTVSSESFSSENDFMDYINKKRMEKKNGSGEDVAVKIFNLLPDLYMKNYISEDSKISSGSRHHQLASSDLSLFEMIQNTKKREAILISTSENKENDVNQKGITPLSNSFLTAVVPVGSLSGKLTYKGDDDTRENITETIKLNSAINPLKNNLISHHKELKTQDIKSRRSSLSIPERISQANASAVMENGITQKKSLNLDYPFLRWAGEHSVKISIPVELGHSGHLTLLPSDPRAAEMLSRQMNQLTGYNTALLHPQQDDEESERRHAQQYREEEQE